MIDHETLSKWIQRPLQGEPEVILVRAAFLLKQCCQFTYRLTLLAPPCKCSLGTQQWSRDWSNAFTPWSWTQWRGKMVGLRTITESSRRQRCIVFGALLR